MKFYPYEGVGGGGGKSFSYAEGGGGVGATQGFGVVFFAVA